MVDLDKDRLVKLLNLTASSHDGEALAAIRKSNELLQQHKSSWSAVMGLDPPVVEVQVERPRPAPAPAPPPTPKPKPSVRPQATATPQRPREHMLPSGYAFARQYRNEFRHQPFLPRLLAFPFWIVIEIVALLRPMKLVNTRGAAMVFTFVISLLLGSFIWIAVGYHLVVGF